MADRKRQLAEQDEDDEFEDDRKRRRILSVVASRAQRTAAAVFSVAAASITVCVDQRAEGDWSARRRHPPFVCRLAQLIEGFV